MDPIKDWLLSLLKGISTHPDEIELIRTTDQMGVLYTLRCSPVDNGRIIGKQGETVGAIRKLLHIRGMNDHARVSLKIDIPPSYKK